MSDVHPAAADDPGVAGDGSAVNDDGLSGGIELTDDVLRNLVLQIAFWEDWVLRRVETVTILDEYRIRRHVSMDFELSDYRGEDERDDNEEKLRLVPITLLTKDTLRNFNITDDCATALPVLTTLQNVSVSCQLLRALSRLDEGAGLPLEQIRQLITEADLANFEESLDKLLDVHPPAEPPVWHPTFRRLARELRESFLLIAWMKLRLGDRRLVKYEYEGTMVVQSAGPVQDPLSRARAIWRRLLADPTSGSLLRWVRRGGRGWRPIRRSITWGTINAERASDGVHRWVNAFRLWLALDPIRINVTAEAVARARSYHIELPAPDGLGFTQARFVVGAPGQEPSFSTVDYAGVDRVHLHAPELWTNGYLNSRKGMVGYATLDLRPSPTQLLRQAFLVAWLIAVVLGIGLVIRDAMGVHPRLDAASALVVGIPAIFAIFLVAPGEHRLAQRLVTGVRDRIWASAGIAFCGAAILTLDLGSGWRPALWLLLFGGASANCLAYFWSIRQTGRDFKLRLESSRGRYIVS